jgi:hypothetical protein
VIGSECLQSLRQSLSFECFRETSMEESGFEDDKVTLLSNEFDGSFCFIGGEIL